VLLALIGAATPAAASAASERMRARDAVARACHARLAPGAAGVDTTRVTARVDGLVQARLTGGGDWDLGVFDARTGRSVAGSAAFATREVAEGFVRRGQRLVVQACRYRGGAGSASLDVAFDAVPLAKDGERVQVVEVATPTREAEARLQGLGLDLTEHGRAGHLEVVLHGADDARRLRAAGLRFEVEIADLEARSARNRAADARYAARVARSDLPSGRDAYRRLADYELELKELAQRHPALVRPLTLAHASVLGRPVQGIEITRDPHRVDDGKPIFLNMGVHHAREWPSSEHAMEFAHDLLASYGRDERATRLVDATRTIVVPVVNPDGFTISREGARPPGSAPFSLFDYEMKRKNCRISAQTPEAFRTGTCEANAAGRLRGTDPNRNYGGLWGGPGASTTWSGDTYRGDEPFSEPEVRNIRALQATRPITNLITNHTYSNLVLRPPGVADVGFPLEEPLYRALGERLAAHNGYVNQPAFELYDTTGTTEDWTFWTAGSLGFTFEIGPEEFHPPFATGVVAEYLGRPPAAGAGRGGNREAYYEMLEATADAGLHSVISGTAPEGATLELSKRFLTSTSPVWADNTGLTVGPALQLEDELRYRLAAPGGAFAWHVNPSTRPIVAGRGGRDPQAPPQAPIALVNPEGEPAVNRAYPVPPYESVPFTVAGPPEADNARVTVHVEWSDPQTDWDLYVLETATGRVAASSTAVGDADEDAVLIDPPPGEYVAHVVNYAQVAGRPFDDWTGEVRFEGPRPRQVNERESWTLTCRGEDGSERATRAVTVDRGETVDVGDACEAR